MSKNFKRVISIVAMLCFILTQVSVFAAESATGVTEFTNGTEYEYNLYQLGTKYWYVNNSTSTLLSGTGVSKYAIAIYKLPLPDLADDQKITNYTFTIPESYKIGNDIASYFRVVSLEGSTALWDSKLNASLTTKDETIKKVLYDANAENAWKAYDVCESIVANPPAEDDATKIYTYTIDISKYANDKYMQNDSDHFYVGVWTNWTAVMAWNQGMPDSSRPRAHFTVGEADALAYTGANVTDGDMYVNKNTKPELYFNRVLSSATATLNGESVDCTVAKGFVRINANLEEGKTYTVAVAATDPTGAQVSAEVSFSTYLGEKITAGPYLVSASGTSAITAIDSYATAGVFVFKLPFPKLEPGKKIGKYTLRYYSGKYGASYARFTKMNQYNEDEIPSITTASEDIAPVYNLNDVPKAYRVEDSSTYHDTGVILEVIGNSNYNIIESEIDLTSYARECYDACGGEKDYFLVAMSNRWTTRMYPFKATSVVNKGYNTLCYAVSEDAPALTLESTSPANGAAKAQSSDKAVFTFNNAIKSATAIVNGEEAECTIKGDVVTVNKDLEQYTDYEISLTATDIYGTPELTSTISFKTGAYYEYSGVKTDMAITFIGADGVLDEQASNHVTSGMNKVAVAAVKIPEYNYDEKLDSFVLRIYTNGNNNVFPYELPGGEWDVASLKYEDVKPYIANRLGKHSYENLGSSNFSVYLDITDYINSCIKKGQEYAYFALSTTSTVRLYNSSYSGASAKPFYNYSVAKKNFGADLCKVVAADSEAAYADAVGLTSVDKASSFKAVSTAINNTANAVNFVVAIAQYNGDELVNVAFTPVAVGAGAKDFDIASEAITIDANATGVKAFAWIESNNAPLCAETVASTK